MNKETKSETKKVVPKKEKTAKVKTKKKSPAASAVKVSKNSKKAAPKKKKSFFSELLENVEYGAKIVGEKTSVIAAETFEKVKKGTIEAIDTSSQVVNDLYYSASEYTEQFKDKIEMKKLDAAKGKYLADLGRLFYKKYKIEKLAFSKFSKTKEFTASLKNIEKLDQEIVELGENLKK
jgi:hypothetical protein